MQKKLLTLALVSSLFAVGATAVQAAEMKIGVVNTEVILRDSPAAQAASKKLEQEFSKRDKDINAAGQRLKSDIERFEKNASTMTEQERIRETSANVTETSRDVKESSEKTLIRDATKNSRSFCVKLIQSLRTSLSVKNMT